MSNDLSYINEDGFTVFTGKYLKKRKTCCKSACLHCPYGFTLKKHGLQFEEVLESHIPLMEEILEESNNSEFPWREYLPGNILFIKLKGVVCGVLFKNHIQIKHLFLKTHFQDQGLSKEMVESYLYI